MLGLEEREKRPVGSPVSGNGNNVRSFMNRSGMHGLNNLEEPSIESSHFGNSSFISPG